MNISQEQALDIAREKINDISKSAGCDLAIMTENTAEIRGGWVFFYNTKRYIDTKDAAFMLAGNGPVYVDRNGIVSILPSSVPWQQAVNDSID